MAKLRDRNVPEPEAPAPPPLWVRQTRAGLQRFDGDLGALDRARRQYCRDHGCYRDCSTSGSSCQGRPVRVGVIRVPPYRLVVDDAVLTDDWHGDE